MASPGKSVLVLGGARSGKSSYAEKMVESSGLQPLYLATGRAFDKEMENRIAIHRDRRGSEWQTVEEPLDLIGALTLNAATDRFVLVDCLTLWLTNLMMAERDITTETASLVAMLPNLAGPVVLFRAKLDLGSCLKIAWHGNFAIMQAFCIRQWPRLRMKFISWRQGCRSG